MASAEPNHLAKVASTSLGQPAVVASTAALAPSKKRKLDSEDSSDAVAGASNGTDKADKADAHAEGATAAMTKLDKGKAKKRRKEEQRALVSSVSCRGSYPVTNGTACHAGQPAQLCVRHARFPRRSLCRNQGRGPTPATPFQAWFLTSLNPAGHSRLCPASTRKRQGAAMALRKGARARPSSHSVTMRYSPTLSLVPRTSRA